MDWNFGTLELGFSKPPPGSKQEIVCITEHPEFQSSRFRPVQARAGSPKPNSTDDPYLPNIHPPLVLATLVKVLLTMPTGWVGGLVDESVRHRHTKQQRIKKNKMS